jgi:hypothetical protein
MQNPSYICHPQMMVNESEEIDNMIHHGINNLLETQSAHSFESKHHSTNSSLERINPSLKIK